MCIMIMCYRVLSLKFTEIHFAFDMASVKNKIGYPAMKITFLLSDLNLSRIKVTSHLHGCLANYTSEESSVYDENTI